MAETTTAASGRPNPDIVSQAYATGGLPPAVALLLPLLIALCGLAAIALAPRQVESVPSAAIDPTITGSIDVAPLFRGLDDARR